MKSRMLTMLLMLSFVVPSGALASTKILLLDDIGAGEATFAFEKDNKGSLTLTARVVQPCWDQDCEPYLYHSRSLLKEFSRQDGEVFYKDGGFSIPCGNTHGIFQRSRIVPTCQTFVSPELVCAVWYKENDCSGTTTKYRVYMNIQKDPGPG